MNSLVQVCKCDPIEGVAVSKPEEEKPKNMEKKTTG
jgi:hypothetical protein